MVDGTQTPDGPPQSFLGLAEIFAITYCTQWRARNLTPPEALFSQAYRIRPPMPLHTACGNVIRMLKQKPSKDALPDEFKRLKDPALYTLNVGRIALAQLARATRVQGAPANVHALLDQMAMTLQADQDFGRIQDEYAAELRARPQQTEPSSRQTGLTPQEPLPRFDARMFRDSLDQLDNDTADTRFFWAIAHPSLRLLNGRNSPPPRLTNYAVSHSYEDRVTDTEASVDVDRPAQDLVELLKPQRWHDSLPTLWPKAMFIQSVPSDRSDDGLKLPEPIAPDTDLPFFEQAMFGWGVLPVTCYRNLLTVRLDGAPLPGDPFATGFTYRQRSCLTSQFFGVATNVGGIDVDHGSASCTDLGGTAAGWCRLTARKASRFDIPTDPLLNRIYNDIAAIGLSLLIELFVLFGAVAPTPAA